MVEKIEPIDPFKWKRSCGHSLLANYSWIDPDTGNVIVICVPCLVEKAGLKPAEILTPDEFQNKYAMVTQ